MSGFICIVEVKSQGPCSCIGPALCICVMKFASPQGFEIKSMVLEVVSQMKVV